MLRADALAKLAETYLAHGPKDLSGGERYEVVVHVEHDVLAHLPRSALPRPMGCRAG